MNSIQEMQKIINGMSCRLMEFEADTITQGKKDESRWALLEQCFPKTLYENKDVWHNQSQQLIFPAEKTLGEMIDIALQHKYNIILKPGLNAKWYLKKSRLEKVKKTLAKSTREYPNRLLYLLEFDVEITEASICGSDSDEA
jgi:hypothetical protein